MPTCGLCKEDFPNRVKIDGVSQNFQRRRFCLKCLPFRSGNRYESVEALAAARQDKKFCKKCRKARPLGAFYPKASGADRGRFAYCKKCERRRKNEANDRLKAEAVAYKGGKCCVCGYARCTGAMAFHHIDPAEKDFGIATRMGANGLTDALRRELDKCALVCGNCHAELHAGIVQFDFADVM